MLASCTSSKRPLIRNCLALLHHKKQHNTSYPFSLQNLKTTREKSFISLRTYKTYKSSRFNLSKSITTPEVDDFSDPTNISEDLVDTVSSTSFPSATPIDPYSPALTTASPSSSTSNSYSPLISSGGVFNVVEFDSSGTFRPKELPRADLYTKFALQGRDVRVLISNMNYPTILVRKKCILIDIRHVHSIICHDRMYLIQSEGQQFKELVTYLHEDLKYQNNTAAASGNLNNHETLYPYSEQPFELQVMESFLKKMCQDVVKEYQLYFDQAQHIIMDPDLGRSEAKLYELLQLKNKINRFRTYVQEFHNAIQQLLENDEDMASMYLTYKSYNNKPRPIDQHEEVEMLLETYYTLLEDIITRISEMNNDIQSTQEFQQICLDTVRNRMLTLELKITFAAFAVSVGALIAGIFGMNLTSGVEQTSGAFYAITSLLLLLCFGVWTVLVRQSKAKGIFKRHYWFEQKAKLMAKQIHK